MGTVRREGDWRLEKRGEGIYEITFRKEPQEKIITSDASPGAVDQPLLETIPVTEVSSYPEAEGLFEERAHGPPPMGFSSSTTGDSGSAGDTLLGGDSVEDEMSDLPPGGIGLALLLSGILVLYIMGLDQGRYVLLIGGVLTLAGVVIFVYAAYLGWSTGWREAWAFLTTIEESNENGSGDESADDSVSKTPQPTEAMKDKVRFGRANQMCEWCGAGPLDNPEVHHIKPRSEGGSNDPDNLIALCPTCHRKADGGGISQTMLRQKLRHIRSEQG